MPDPRITFGMIVLNGEPYIRYNLRALYPFAHEIIVVEGAAPTATGISTEAGHSRDATVASVEAFVRDEDPDNKVQLVTAEDEGFPDGFWPGEKDQQSRAYCSRATGDYIWQVDVDEFYQPYDMKQILQLLGSNSSITQVSFKQLSFWGGFDYLTDGWYMRLEGEIFQRIFRWGPGYRYITHRPPTVADDTGRNLRNRQYVDGYWLAKQGIFLHHYCLTFPHQVREKCDYYGTAGWANRGGAQAWARESFERLQRPYRVHNVYEYPSWLERFRGTHPPEIERLRRDIDEGRLDVPLRPTDDVEALLDSTWYRIGRAALRASAPIFVFLKRCWRLSGAGKIIRAILKPRSETT